MYVILSFFSFFFYTIFLFLFNFFFFFFFSCAFFNLSACSSCFLRSFSCFFSASISALVFLTLEVGVPCLLSGEVEEEVVAEVGLVGVEVAEIEELVAEDCPDLAGVEVDEFGVDEDDWEVDDEGALEEDEAEDDELVDNVVTGPVLFEEEEEWEEGEEEDDEEEDS